MEPERTRKKAHNIKNNPDVCYFSSCPKRQDKRRPWACINEAGSSSVDLIGKEMYYDRPWHIQTLTRSHVLAIS
jgi:hypothetical protein